MKMPGPREVKTLVQVLQAALMKLSHASTQTSCDPLKRLAPVVLTLLVFAALWNSGHAGRSLKEIQRLRMASQVALVVKNPLANAGDVRDGGSVPGLGDSLEEGMTTLSSILAWRIPWTEEPGRLHSVGSDRVGHDWSDLAHTHRLGIAQVNTHCSVNLSPVGSGWVFMQASSALLLSMSYSPLGPVGTE